MEPASWSLSGVSDLTTTRKQSKVRDQLRLDKDLAPPFDALFFTFSSAGVRLLISSY